MSRGVKDSLHSKMQSLVVFLHGSDDADKRLSFKGRERLEAGLPRSQKSDRQWLANNAQNEAVPALESDRLERGGIDLRMAL
jgi:hypothetical protein